MISPCNQYLHLVIGLACLAHGVWPFLSHANNYVWRNKHKEFASNVVLLHKMSCVVTGHSIPVCACLILTEYCTLPAGRSAERPILSVDEIKANVSSLQSTLERLLSSDDNDGPKPDFKNNLVSCSFNHHSHKTKDIFSVVGMSVLHVH